MLLLKSLIEGQFEGFALDHAIEQYIGQAAAELLHFTVTPKYSRKSEQNTSISGSGQEHLNTLLSGPCSLDDESYPQWERRLLSALHYLELVRATIKELQYQEAIDSLLDAIKESAQLVFEEVYSSSKFIGAMTFQAEYFLRRYLDFGVVSPDTLAMALAQDLRYRDFVPNERLVTCNVYPGINIKMCPAELSLAAFWGDSRLRPRLEGIGGYTERTLEILDNADSVAEKARKANLFSDFLLATHVTHLLYNVAQTALKWITQRYERAHKSVPSDLYREFQISEENRAATMETLLDPCENLISYPLTHLTGQILIRKEIPERDTIAGWLADGIARNPVYPDRMRQVWGDVVQTIDLGKPPDYLAAAWRLRRILHKEVESLIAFTFEDSHIVQAIYSIGRKWPADTEIFSEVMKKIRED